jgi:hypothetical protein
MDEVGDDVGEAEHWENVAWDGESDEELDEDSDEELDGSRTKSRNKSCAARSRGFKPGRRVSSESCSKSCVGGPV